MATTTTAPPNGPGQPETRRRGPWMPVLAVCLAVVVAAFVALRVVEARSGSAAAPASPALFSQPHVLFRSLEPGADYSRLAYVPTADMSAPRSVADTPRCHRAAAADTLAVCLRPGTNPAQPFEVAVLGEGLRAVSDEPLNGSPSRARVSPDGEYFATTTFVDGHNYISLGFSTETIVYEVGGEPLGNLEEFAFLINGKQDNSIDRNIWGVTFASDSNTFFATVASRGRTYLAQGDIERRTLTALKDNAECPSLSPDGSTIVYKKRVGESATDAWRFYSFDLSNGVETPLGEQRSIDDQVAWLDSEHVMYGVPKSGEVPGAADIWVAPLDGGAPTLLIPDADSPTLVGG